MERVGDKQTRNSSLTGAQPLSYWFIVISSPTRYRYKVTNNGEGSRTKTGNFYDYRDTMGLSRFRNGNKAVSTWSISTIFGRTKYTLSGLIITLRHRNYYYSVLRCFYAIISILIQWVETFRTIIIEGLEEI